MKFVDKNGSHGERVVTAIDRGILELKSAIFNLQRLVEAIQEKLNEWDLSYCSRFLTIFSSCSRSTKKATLALQRKQKSLAISYLRSRKQLEDVLQKRLASLATLESTMISIEVAAGDIGVSLEF